VTWGSGREVGFASSTILGLKVHSPHHLMCVHIFSLLWNQCKAKKVFPLLNAVITFGSGIKRKLFSVRKYKPPLENDFSGWSDRCMQWEKMRRSFIFLLYKVTLSFQYSFKYIFKLNANKYLKNILIIAIFMVFEKVKNVFICIL